MAEQRLAGQPAAVASPGWTPRALGNLAVWIVPGFLFAFAIAGAASIGLLVLPVALLVAVVALFLTKGRGFAGFLVGSGLVGLLLAWLNRHSAAAGCGPDECGGFAPEPFLVAGLTAVVLGLAIELWLGHRRGARSPAR
ncbi:MAG: hypothetical protein QM804_15270 [Propionicimonas sp.]